MKPGDIGQLVSGIVPDCILFGTKFFREWYDSNPYRRFEGNNDDTRGKEITHDILVVKDVYSDFAEIRPVVVIEGSSAGTKDERMAYQYHATVYFDADKNTDLPERKRISLPRIFPKSHIEKYYKKLVTIKDLSQETLNLELENAVKSYDKKIDYILLYQDLLYLNDKYTHTLF